MEIGGTYLAIPAAALGSLGDPSTKGGQPCIATRSAEAGSLLAVCCDSSRAGWGTLPRPPSWIGTVTCCPASTREPPRRSVDLGDQTSDVPERAVIQLSKGDRRLCADSPLSGPRGGVRRSIRGLLAAVIRRAPSTSLGRRRSRRPSAPTSTCASPRHHVTLHAASGADWCPAGTGGGPFADRGRGSLSVAALSCLRTEEFVSNRERIPPACSLRPGSPTRCVRPRRRRFSPLPRLWPLCSPPRRFSFLRSPLATE